MTTVTLFKTNDVDDPGFEIDTEDIAAQFWASDQARNWVAGQYGNLERLAMNWVLGNLGGWAASDDEAEMRRTWDTIYSAIHAAMPHSETTR